MATLTSVFDDAHVRKYPKGQILLYQGEKTNDVFRIRSGYVKVYDVNSSGIEKLLIILGPDDLFPLVWTFRSPEALHYFYESIDTTELAVVSRQKLISSLSKSHKFTVHLLEYFVERTSDLMKRIECIEGTSAKHKVAQTLEYLAHALGDPVKSDELKVKVPITHQMIGDMAGITRETASLQLKQLEKLKIYKNNNNHLIINSKMVADFLANH